MRQVQTSGVLMVFSQAWIEELYHQVLDRNMLGEAGYWGSPEDNSLPLITMLTGQWLRTGLCATCGGGGEAFREAMLLEADLEAAPARLPGQWVTVSEKVMNSQTSSVLLAHGTLQSSLAPFS